MSDEDERGVGLPVQLLKQLYDPKPGLPVEISGGFVGKQQARLIGERPGQGHTLLLTPRELGRIVVRSVAEADPLEKLTAPFPDGPTVAISPGSQELQGDHHVLQRRKRGQQVECLEDEAYVLCTKPGATVFGKTEEIFTGDDYLTFGGLIEPGQEP